MIKHVRQALNLDQGKLAVQANLSIRALQNIEAEKARPSLSTLTRLVKALRQAYLDFPPPLPVPELDAMVKRYLNDGWKPEDLDLDDFDPSPGGKRRKTRKTKEASNETDELGREDRMALESEAATAKPQGSIGKRASTRSVGNCIGGSSFGVGQNCSAIEKIDLQGPITALHGFSKSQSQRSVLTNAGNEKCPREISNDEQNLGIQEEYLNSKISAASQYVASLDFTRADIEGWTRAFYEAPEGAVQITRRAIISRIQQCPAYTLKKTESGIKKQLSEMWNKRLRGRPARQRRVDPELHDNRAWVCELLAGWIFAEERREPHAKGAYSKRAWMDDLPKLRAAYDCFRDQIVARLGREPSVHTIATWCRDLYGKSDKVERAKEHYQKMIGLRARYAGEVWFLDATGLPFQVDGVQAAANRQGKVAQWAHLRTDLASGQTHTWWNPGKSETDGWSDALVNFLTRAGYAPAWAICDRISHLFSDLCRIEAGKTDELTMGVVAMLACGVKPYVHAAERPTAGASVERAVRTYKNSVVEQLFRMRIAKAMQGRDQKAWRRFEGEDGFREFLTQSESHMNASMLHRGDNKRTRSQLFDDHAESVAWRSGRALAPNFQTHLFAEILPRRRAVRVAGGEIDYRRDGRRISARLNGELPLSAREGVALAIPGGALARDEDPDLMRVVVVQVGQGLPKFYQIEAYADRRDFFGEIERKPFVGEHPVAVPATERDAEALRRQAAAANVRQIAAMKGDERKNLDIAYARLKNGGEEPIPPVEICG